MKRIINPVIVISLSFTLLVLMSCSKPQSKQNEQQSKNQALSTTNLVVNGNFEEGTTTPTGWHTYNQFLNDVTGWVTDEHHSGTHSLKIENIGGSDAYWQGEPITFNEPINSLNINIWTKTKGLKKNSILLFSLKIIMKNKINDTKEERISINLPETNHQWLKTMKKLSFFDRIITVIPYIQFKGIGTVWFDSININGYNLKPNILFDSNQIEKYPFYKIHTTSKINVLSDGIYKLKGIKEISSVLVPVETDKEYEISGLFKSIGEKNSSLLFGVASYNKNKQWITIANINMKKNTETELVKGYESGQRVLFVKNAENWKIGPRECIAFNIDNSGTFNDLPNFNLSDFGIKNIAKENSYWKILLDKPLSKNFTKGTKIREHSDGPTYEYLYSITVPSKWINCQKLLGNVENINGLIRFWPGTKYVKIVILANYEVREGDLEVKNITLKTY